MDIVVDKEQVPEGYSTRTTFENTLVRVCKGGGSCFGDPYKPVHSITIKGIELTIIGGESFGKFIDGSSDPCSSALLYITQEPSRISPNVNANLHGIILACFEIQRRDWVEQGRREKQREILTALGIYDA